MHEKVYYKNYGVLRFRKSPIETFSKDVIYSVREEKEVNIKRKEVVYKGMLT